MYKRRYLKIGIIGAIALCSLALVFYYGYDDHYRRVTTIGACIVDAKQAILIHGRSLAVDDSTQLEGSLVESCMAAHGYILTSAYATQLCKPEFTKDLSFAIFMTTSRQEEAACYVPAGKFSRDISWIEIWRERQ